MTISLRDIQNRTPELSALAQALPYVMTLHVVGDSNPSHPSVVLFKNQIGRGFVDSNCKESPRQQEGIRLINDPPRVISQVELEELEQPEELSALSNSHPPHSNCNACRHSPLSAHLPWQLVLQPFFY